MKKTLHTLTISAMLAGSAMLAACTETYHGAGRDIEKAGENMQEQFD